MPDPKRLVAVDLRERLLKMIRAALVEDDNGARRTLELILLRSGGIVCVGSYSSGREAMQRIPVTQPDVILMDICMSGMNGIDCTRQLKQILPGIKIVMITALDDLQSLQDALRAGASGYLTKPFGRAECIEAIQFAVAGGAPLSHKIVGQLSDRAGSDRGGSADVGRRLNHRERLLLDFLSRGFSDKEIADLAHLSLCAVQSSLKRMYRKIDVPNRTAAAQKWTGHSAPAPASPLDEPAPGLT